MFCCHSHAITVNDCIVFNYIEAYCISETAYINNMWQQFHVQNAELKYRDIMVVLPFCRAYFLAFIVHKRDLKNLLKTTKILSSL